MEAAAKVTALMKQPYHACKLRHEVEDLLGMLGSMELVVGMRLHSLIFATGGGAPVIGISYDIKVDSFISDIGSDACIPLKELTAEGLTELIDKTVAAGRSSVEAARSRLGAGEQRNINCVKELLGMEVC